MSSHSHQARLTLLSAFERFAATVTPDDQRVFDNTKLQDVRDEAIQIERQLRARRTQRNMARLEPFLRGVEHYSKVVEVLCNGTPYLPWIWAPVKLMLMVTVDTIGAFEKLIEAYGKISDMLPRLDRLGSTLHNDFNFQNVLALVYSDIIEFHRRAYKFVRRKSWAVFFGSMWSGFESRFNNILQNLAYHSELVDKEAVAADISDAVRRHKEDGMKWEQQEREWEALKVQTVLSWLGTSENLPADTLERYIRDCLPSSCDWFAQHPKIQLWLEDSRKDALLWLHGKPGAGRSIFRCSRLWLTLAGKSMICASLIQHIEQKAVVLYYFCSFVGHTVDGHSRLLRSLVSQIIHGHQDLAVYVHDIYFKSHPAPTKKALLNLLLDLLSGLASVRIVIDGLDEWHTGDQKDLLKDLGQILSTSKTSNICKILIASRDTLDVTRILRKKGNAAVTVSLSDSDEEAAVTHAISLYVEDKLSDLPEHFIDLDPDASIMNEVKSTLLKKAHGMFLWVRLVLDSLDAVYSPEELRSIVNDLPTDLEKLYRNIYERMCTVHGAHSHGGVARILSWICFAQRPLHKHELLQALSVPRWGVGSDKVQTAPIPSILDHCKPFVEERADATVMLVHFSVKEFFLKFDGPHFVTPLQAELDLSSVCIIILVRGLGLLRPDTHSSTHARIASGNYRLLPYALKFWIEHCYHFIAKGGTPDLKNPLIHHLARLHEAHRLLLASLNRSSIFVPEVVDGPELQNHSHLPAFALIREVRRIRRLASENGYENGPNAYNSNVKDSVMTSLASRCHAHELQESWAYVETFALQNDQTLFTKLATDFERGVIYLLSQSEVDGIPSTVLRAFQQSYGSTAFRCRYPQCEMSCSGFASQQLRIKHETMHFQRVYCRVSSCQFSRVGFAKNAALSAHVRNFHAHSAMLPIPSKVRRSKDINDRTVVQYKVVKAQASQYESGLEQAQMPANEQQEEAVGQTRREHWTSDKLEVDSGYIAPPGTPNVASPAPVAENLVQLESTSNNMGGDDADHSLYPDEHYFDCNSLSIGTWRRVGYTASELSISYSFQKCCVIYNIRNGTTDYKIEYPFSYIKDVYAGDSESGTNSPSALVFVLNRAPNFFMTSSETRAFFQCQDFTEAQQASHVMQHHISGDPKALRDQLSILVLSESFRNRQTNSLDPTSDWSSAPRLNSLAVPPKNNFPATLPSQYSGLTNIYQNQMPLVPPEERVSGHQSPTSTSYPELKPLFDPHAGPATNVLTRFVSHYRQQIALGKVPQGWQQSIRPEERAQLCQQLFIQYSLLKPDSESGTMRDSVNFETQRFVSSLSKDQYINNIKSELVMMIQARQTQLSLMQGNLEPMSPNQYPAPLPASATKQWELIAPWSSDETESPLSRSSVDSTTMSQPAHDSAAALQNYQVHLIRLEQMVTMLRSTIESKERDGLDASLERGQLAQLMMDTTQSGEILNGDARSTESNTRLEEQRRTRREYLDSTWSRSPGATEVAPTTDTKQKEQQHLEAYPLAERQPSQQQDYNMPLFLLAQQDEKRQRLLVIDMEKAGLDTTEERQKLAQLTQYLEQRREQLKQGYGSSLLPLNAQSPNAGDAQASASRTANTVSPPAQVQDPSAIDYQTYRLILNERKDINLLEQRLDGDPPDPNNLHATILSRQKQLDEMMEKLGLCWHPDTGALIKKPQEPQEQSVDEYDSYWDDDHPAPAQHLAAQSDAASPAAKLDDYNFLLNMLEEKNRIRLRQQRIDTNAQQGIDTTRDRADLAESQRRLDAMRQHRPHLVSSKPSKQ